HNLGRPNRRFRCRENLVEQLRELPFVPNAMKHRQIEKAAACEHSGRNQLLLQHNRLAILPRLERKLEVGDLARVETVETTEDLVAGRSAFVSVALGELIVGVLLAAVSDLGLSDKHGLPWLVSTYTLGKVNCDSIMRKVNRI